MDRDDDIIMESTTDTPEQIAAGLEIEPAPALEPESAPGGEGLPEAQPLELDDDAPVGEVTPIPARVAAPRRKATAPEPKAAARPIKKDVQGAAAAARRKADARAAVLELENEALRARLTEVATGAPAPKPAAQAPARTVITADQVPDTHPRVAAVQREITDLGPEPTQEKFPDFDEFNRQQRSYDRRIGRLEAKLDRTKEDVARDQTAAATAAEQRAAQTATAFEQSISKAKELHADYDDVMEVARAEGLQIPRVVSAEIMESAIGAEISYYLAQHPEVVEKLWTVTPTRALIELGIIEDRVTASLLPARRDTTRARTTARTTSAPDPQGTLVGDLPTGGRRRDLNDPTLSQAEYNRLRDEMDRETGRRLH